MVLNMSESRLLMMYIEGLNEPMRGWVKYFNLVTLQYATKNTQDLVGEANKTCSHLDLQSLQWVEMCAR
jgi:hypothetical protein